MPEWKSIPVDSTYALTTIFTAPEWCTSLLYTWHPLAEFPAAPSIFVRAQQGQRSFADKYSDCYPPNFATVAALYELPYEQTFTKFWDVVTAYTAADRGVYSPGVCPSGWTSWSATRPYEVPASDPASWYNCCPMYASLQTSEQLWCSLIRIVASLGKIWKIAGVRPLLQLL